MKFSIITPAYNGLAKIKQAIGSVRGQQGVRLEHLVQDAASPDGSAAWLEAQEGINVVSEPDQGMYDAINKGWARATGDILSWLNVDEQYLPGTLERVHQAFESYPEIDFIFGDSILVDPHGEVIAARREIPLREIYVKNGFLYALSCTMFFRRQLWDQGRLKFNTEFKTAGDADLVLRLLQAGCRSLHLPHYLSLFGVDGNNLSITLAKSMNRETADLGKKYGAFSQAPMRKLVMGGRYLERLFKGCYWPVNISYAYAVNEIPEYIGKTGRRVSSRFTYERAIRTLTPPS